MAVVTDYTCSKCGLELSDDGRVFIWDGESGETRDFLILMNTYMLLDGAKISGKVYETFCRQCDRYVKVYSIREVHEGIENPVELVTEGIRRRNERCRQKTEKLRAIRERSKYSIERDDDYYIVTFPEYDDFEYSNDYAPEMTKDEVIRHALNDFHEEIDGIIESYEHRICGSHYLVVDETDVLKDEFDLFEKVKCPECGSKINKHVSGELPCPRCGGFIFGLPICYD